MPPQQTLTSETTRDAAASGPDLSIALLTGVTGSASPAARHDASTAALRDALSEKDAAGPPASGARSVLSRLARYWRAFQETRRSRRLRVSVRDLSERQLMDIGLPAGDIDHIAAHRAIERLRDGTAHLWTSRGVM
jgi:uncharacterized protein YjiS (DUF1127 family)